jgi:hypothetical protein
VKLSDLNAVKQQTITRAGITLSAIGLLATASAGIGSLLPNLSDTQSHLYHPLLVYAAAVYLPFGALMGTRALHVGLDLQCALMARLETTAGHPDEVSPELQSLFVKNIEQCLADVDRGINALVAAGGLLVGHVYLILERASLTSLKLPTDVRNLLGPDISDFAANYDSVAIGCIIYVSVSQLASYLLNRKARHQKRTARLASRSKNSRNEVSGFILRRTSQLRNWYRKL